MKPRNITTSFSPNHISVSGPGNSAHTISHSALHDSISPMYEEDRRYASQAVKDFLPPKTAPRSRAYQESCVARQASFESSSGRSVKEVCRQELPMLSGAGTKVRMYRERVSKKELKLRQNDEEMAKNLEDIKRGNRRHNDYIKDQE